MASAYFEAQLPVTERVVRLLAGKFGFVLQKYGRKCRQCGEVPSLAVARNAPTPRPPPPRSDSMISRTRCGPSRMYRRPFPTQRHTQGTAPGAGAGAGAGAPGLPDPPSLPHSL